MQIMRELAQRPAGATFTTRDIARLLEEVLVPPFNSTAKAERFTHRMVACGLFVVDEPAAGRRPGTFLLDRERLRECLQAVTDYATGKPTA